MPRGRHARRWVFGILGLAAVSAGLLPLMRGEVKAPSKVDGRTTLVSLAESLHRGDPRGVAELLNRAKPPADGKLVAPTETEALTWVEALSGLRGGFLSLPLKDRIVAVEAACKVLNRFAAEPAPPEWFRATGPVHDILTSALADPSAMVRVAAMNEVARLWTFEPGRPMIAVEEETLAGWKATFQASVVRRLADPEPESRVAAVACLGTLPLSEPAAPAVAYLEDPSPVVRQQVLSSFSRRPSLLPEELILKRLYDRDARVATTAEIVLTARGLSKEQIGLGKMISHPKAELRASVIPLLVERTDLDPVVWLLQLSHDPEEFVRTKSIEALASRVEVPEVRTRLEEMSAYDGSATVRQSAAKHLPAGSEATAALPPLPGSPILNPKAN
ncbi:hypothetical protein EP7_000604 [Isosphaeraceae bacterium EP7]